MAIGMANDHLSSECEALEVARREMAQAQAALAETQKRADGLAALLEQERAATKEAQAKAEKARTDATGLADKLKAVQPAKAASKKQP